MAFCRTVGSFRKFPAFAMQGPRVPKIEKLVTSLVTWRSLVATVFLASVTDSLVDNSISGYFSQHNTS